MKRDQVGIQVGFVTGLIVAKFTVKWFLAGMETNVFLEVVAQSCTIRALRTSEGFNVCVEHKVSR